MTFKAKAKDFSFKAKAKDTKIYSLRTRPRTNITEFSPPQIFQKYSSKFTKVQTSVSVLSLFAKDFSKADLFFCLKVAIPCRNVL